MKVFWSKELVREFEEAINLITNMDPLAKELFVGLIRNSSEKNKSIALVLEGEDPVAVIAMKKRDSSWIHLNHYLYPGANFPCKEGYFARSLKILKKNLWTSWWRRKESFPEFDKSVIIEKIPTFGLDLSTDFEEYWRKSKIWKDIQNAKNKCSKFRLLVNEPGSAEWIYRKSEEVWRTNPHEESSDLADKIYAINFLEEMGKSYALTLTDGQKMIAGSTLIEHDNDLVGQYVYRDRDYNKYSLGTYLFYRTFKWAAETEFKFLDMGGDYPEYKMKWCPRLGEKYNINTSTIITKYQKNLNYLLTKLKVNSKS